jgi:hypothetical protein
MTTFKTSRKIPATVEQVFAAFQPKHLARWWGPAGFTNTFSICEFKNGGPLPLNHRRRELLYSGLRYLKIQKLLAVWNLSSSPPMSKILSACPLKF